MMKSGKNITVSFQILHLLTYVSYLTIKVFRQKLFELRLL